MEDFENNGSMEEAFRKAFQDFEDAPPPFAAISAYILPKEVPLWRIMLKRALLLLPLVLLTLADTPFTLPKEPFTEEGASLLPSSKESHLKKPDLDIAPIEKASLTENTIPRIYTEEASRTSTKTTKDTISVLGNEMPLLEEDKPLVDSWSTTKLLQQNTPATHLLLPISLPIVRLDSPYIQWPIPIDTLRKQSTEPSTEPDKPLKLRLLIETGRTYAQSRIQPNTNDEWVLTKGANQPFSSKNAGFSGGIGVQIPISQKTSIDAVASYTVIRKHFDFSYQSKHPDHYIAQADSLHPNTYTMTPVYAPSMQERASTRWQLFGWRLGITKKLGNRQSISAGVGQDALLRSHIKNADGFMVKSQNLPHHLAYGSLNIAMPWSGRVRMEVSPKACYYFSSMLSPRGAMRAKPYTFGLQIRFIVGR